MGCPSAAGRAPDWSDIDKIVINLTLPWGGRAVHAVVAGTLDLPFSCYCRHRGGRGQRDPVFWVRLFNLLAAIFNFFR
jgi:hypothetical protein